MGPPLRLRSLHPRRAGQPGTPGRPWGPRRHPRYFANGTQPILLSPQSSPNGVRTRVSTLRGWCPRPLDDGTRPRPQGLGTAAVPAHRRALLHSSPEPGHFVRSGGRARTSNLMNQNHARCQLRHPRMGEPPS